MGKHATAWKSNHWLISVEILLAAIIGLMASYVAAESINHLDVSHVKPLKTTTFNTPQVLSRHDISHHHTAGL